MGWLRSINQSTLCPSIKDVFKAFKLCPYNIGSQAKMPYHIWKDINKIPYNLYGERIEWFKEEKF